MKPLDKLTLQVVRPRVRPAPTFQVFGNATTLTLNACCYSMTLSSVLSILDAVSFQDYHDDIRQEQMWEMQALTTSSSVNGNGSVSGGSLNAGNNSSSSIDHELAGSPNHLVEGGITDMDTSNDEKSDESNGMDCLANEKLDSAAQLRIRAPTNVGMVTTSIAGDPLKLTPNAAPSK